MATSAIFICAIMAMMQVQLVMSVIPEECANVASLRNKVCCPGRNDPCGDNAGRGSCAQVNVAASNRPADDDIRYGWPTRLFQRVCMCNNNYGGVDCSGCKFGYAADSDGNCIKHEIRARNSLRSLPDWSAYVAVLNRTKYTKSRYFVVTEAFKTAIKQPDDQALMAAIVNPNLYDLFVWIHHFVAKDSERTGLNKVDFAHEGTGFLTWHRLFLVWMEREIRENVDKDFSLYYWDWTNPDDREEFFKTGRLDISEPPLSRWNTYCWFSDKNGQICDPTDPIKDGSSRNIFLSRCPDRDACDRNGIDWPTEEDEEEALRQLHYDNENWDKEAKDSFRNYLEGFVPLSGDCPSPDVTKLCNDSLQRKLHNSVHLLLGPGDFDSNMDFYTQGVMGDVAASPNDPIFFNHHTMIDCVMERWINSNENAGYPGSSKIAEGHRKDDYIVPFLPLYKHQEMLDTSDKFGYECVRDGGGGGDDLSPGDIAGISLGSIVGGGAIFTGVGAALYFSIPYIVKFFQ